MLADLGHLAEMVGCEAVDGVVTKSQRPSL